MEIGKVLDMLNICPEKPKLLMGPPGVGKTAIVSQWAESLGRKLYCVPLAHFEPEDLKGIPYVSNDGKLEIKKGPLIPGENEEAIVFFDEITCVSPQKIAIALKAVDEKRIGYFNFPRSYVVSAGNPQEFGGYELDSRVVSRFIKIDVDVDAVSFTTYITRKYNGNKAAACVVGFVNFDKTKLLVPPKTMGEPFATPRGWEAVVMMHPDGQFNHCLVNGAIGTAVGSQFLAYVKMAKTLDIIEDVLNIRKPLPRFTTDKNDVAYAITAALSFRVDESNASRAAEFIKNMRKHLPHDLFLMFLKIVYSRGIMLQNVDLKETFDLLLKVS